MFAERQEATGQVRERRRKARRVELLSLCEQEARIEQRITQIVRARSPPTSHTHRL